MIDRSMLASQIAEGIVLSLGLIVALLVGSLILAAAIRSLKGK